MIYVALLRGINVGGKNKVDMKKLKSRFESVGMKNVHTYINSGNIIFESSLKGESLVSKLEAVIKKDFELDVKVVVRSQMEFENVIDTLPGHWTNDDSMKSDVMFLWEDIDSPDIVNELVVKDGIDEVIYVPGAVLWRTDREKVSKSGKMKLASQTIYKMMTVRNVNTVRKIFELMQKAA